MTKIEHHRADDGPRVLIVSGPPGSGKTTVASLLTSRRRRAVHVESDYFFRFIRSGFIEPWKSESHEQNALVMAIVAQAAARYATAGYFTVIDGIISPGWFLQPLRAALTKHGLPVAYVILRPPLATAIERASERKASALADPAVIAQLYDDFADIAGLAEHVIDNGAQSAAETADAVDERLRRGGLLV